MLWKLAKDSRVVDGVNKKDYSKSVAICVLNGIPQKFPMNFISEQGKISFSDSFLYEDPLGWNDDLSGGAYVIITPELGLISLEFPPDRLTGDRDIVDVITYDRVLFSNLDDDFYEESFGILIEEIYQKAESFSANALEGVITIGGITRGVVEPKVTRGDK